jgi:hypothetical protein
MGFLSPSYQNVNVAEDSDVEGGFEEMSSSSFWW